MKNCYKKLAKGEAIFVGIDLHKKTWHVTIRSADIELFNSNIPGNWGALKHQLKKYKEHPIHAVYEAGYFGFWLHDYLINFGADCIVTPPSLIPLEYGNNRITSYNVCYTKLLRNAACCAVQEVGH